MFSSIQGFGQQAFISLVTIAVIIITGYIIRPGRLKPIETLTIASLLIIIGIQYYNLVLVVTYLPASQHWVYDSSLARKMCINSDKGGKRPAGSYMDYDINPCFCKTASSRCYTKHTGIRIHGACPTDGSAYCMEDASNTTEINLFLNTHRNCAGGQFDKCSKDQPCYPCELSQVIAFNTTRCRSCTSDFTGNCNFVEGVGPYCYQSVGSRKIGPCKKCCTEPQIVMLNNNETCI